MSTHFNKCLPDTVACVLTPSGEGGISVIEVAGTRALKTMDRLFRNPRGKRLRAAEPGQLLYGSLWRDGVLLDEVIVACIETDAGQVLELNCHGGALASRRVLEALIAEGVQRITAAERLARQRAEGWIDPIAAAAAMRIPMAPTFPAATVLLAQYNGALQRVLEAWLAAAQQGALPPADEVRSLLDTAPFGIGLTDPPRVVLAGRPNAGKSTLANALLRFDRMIVHHLAGTTRDTIEEIVAVGGLPFVLVDTAGLWEARDEIEREGVRRGREALGRADVAVLVFDGSERLQPEDHALLDGPLPPRRVAAITKCDLPLQVEEDRIRQPARCTLVHVSGTTDAGIPDLERAILETACPRRPADGDAVIFTRAQAEQLQAAADAARTGDADRFRERVSSVLGRK